MYYVPSNWENTNNSVNKTGKAHVGDLVAVKHT